MILCDFIRKIVKFSFLDGGHFGGHFEFAQPTRSRSEFFGSASLTFWQISLFYIYIYRFIYIYITRPTISNYKRKNCILVSCQVFIVKICGSLTCLRFRYFVSMKNGVNINALLWRTTKILRYYKPVPIWGKCITNRRSYVLKTSYQLPFFLRRFFCTFF